MELNLHQGGESGGYLETQTVTLNLRLCRGVSKGV